MKTQKFQEKLASAKAYAKVVLDSRQRTMREGVYIPHCYDQDAPRELTWWDDFGFMLGSQWVSVAWVHPRMAYTDAVDELAHAEVEHLYISGKGNDILSNMTPNYEKVGNSRKKIVTYSSANSEHRSTWYTAFVEAQKRLMASDNGIIIRPEIKVEQLNWSRFVSVRYPVEIRNETDIIILAGRIKAHLLRTENLMDDVKDYTYSVSNYLAEKTLDEVVSCDTLSHQMGDM
jgi:hypothetical protein